MDLLNVYISICFSRYSEGIPALQTESQTQVTHELVLQSTSMQYLLFSIFHEKYTKIDNLSKIFSLDNSCKNPEENWQVFPIRQVISTQIFLYTTKTFSNFSFLCFHWKITWHLGKVTKIVKTERVSNWIDAQSSCLGFPSFNVPASWFPKRTNKLLL